MQSKYFSTKNILELSWIKFIFQDKFLYIIYRYS